jgi:hypothetical protein
VISVMCLHTLPCATWFVRCFCELNSQNNGANDVCVMNQTPGVNFAAASPATPALTTQADALAPEVLVQGSR